jgi:hypothetical protein
LPRRSSAQDEVWFRTFLLDSGEKLATPPRPKALEVRMSDPTTAALDAVHRFRIEVREEELAELHRRIAATRWPSKELVTDRSQGVQLATIQELARYWGPMTTGGCAR